MFSNIDINVGVFYQLIIEYNDKMRRLKKIEDFDI